MTNQTAYIGNKIKALRKARKLSQEDLASLAQCSSHAISQIERGINIPKIETVKRIAESLNVEITELTGGSTTTSKKGDRQRLELEIWAELSNADMQTLQAVRDIIRSVVSITKNKT